MEVKRRASHIIDDIEGHFREYQRYKNHWGILDETGYQIGIVSRSLVIAPIDYEAIYVNDPANRELVTSTECVPPIVIFRKHTISVSTSIMIWMAIIFGRAQSRTIGPFVFKCALNAWRVDTTRFFGQAGPGLVIRHPRRSDLPSWLGMLRRKTPDP